MPTELILIFFINTESIKTLINKPVHSLSRIKLRALD